MTDQTELDDVAVERLGAAEDGVAEEIDDVDDVAAEGDEEDDAEGDAEGDEEDDAEDEEDDEDAEGEDATAAPKRKAATDADLFRQSEIAADYIEGLLDILDADGDIDELVSAGRPVVEVVGSKLQSLVGPRGATLEALQELTRLAIFKQTGEPSRLLLDVGGYRDQRRKELGALAKNAVEKVKQHGEAVKLEPMSAFERKCVHDVVNASAGVQSESEGVEPNRRIVVRPA
ncbi:R3H domain-containing nucleic acid-binding protein [Catellatospora sp. KI3]|uniref:Jag family protein n=1 Tax=Catellatospora sp. KI3 TaxID=3041620 RepID=UPI0024825001|nr:R3H domain-containing nucleic acid-binding protein [Catellatospora sp. KI3]MDI1464144.1 R3H domain-containing nucleic acid-binding protein [Catellatospora sp. KI3]